jgi:hypothetical protein
MALDPNGGCTTPEELYSDPNEKQQMERNIERVIIGHFRGSKAAQGAIDIFTDPGINGPQTVTDWLSRNSFGRVIDKSQMMKGFAIKDTYSVPDIITNRGTLAKSEFYDIKPKSKNGVRDGNKTVNEFNRLNTDFELLFFPGEDYDPRGDQSDGSSVPFPSIDIAGESYDIELKWSRGNLGLILYELCYRRRQKQEAPSHVLGKVLLFFLALALALIFKTLPGMDPPPAPAGFPLGPPAGPSA